MVKAAAPEAKILVDEAYFEYVDDPGYATAVPLAQADPRVFVTRTFSKIFGMAGLRVGYAIAHPDTIAALRKQGSSGTLSSASLAAAAAALADTAHLTAERARNTAARAFTRAKFEAAGYRVLPSSANFVMIDIKRDAGAFGALCRKNQIGVARPFPPLSTCVRLSIGTQEEMDEAVPAMLALLEAAPPVSARAAVARHRLGRRGGVLTHALAALSRRHFLQGLGQTSGAVAVHEAMRGLGFLADDPPPPAISGRAPRGARVAILGGGLAGMAAAIELEALGYHCDVLEARPRAGGRCFTVRGGTASEEPALAGLTARYDAGLYLNAGPARIPHHHTATLDWCRELGVAIEPFLCANEAAWVHDAASGRKMRVRELRADFQGHTSELLAKAVSRDALDAPFGPEDRERLIEWLRRQGALGADLRYTGTPRRGYQVAPGPGDTPGVVEIRWRSGRCSPPGSAPT